MSLSKDEITTLIEVHTAPKEYPSRYNPDLPKKGMGRWGLSDNQAKALKEEQRNKCFLCGRSGQTLCLDHNHKTKEARKYLCRFCNIRLGFFEAWLEFVELEDVLEYMKL